MVWMESVVARLKPVAAGPPSSAHASAALRSRLPLIALAIACELVYLLYFLRRFPLVRYYQRDLTMGDITDHSHPEFFAFVGLVSLLFILWGIACALSRNADNRISPWLVLGFGALFALTLTLVYPITSTDLFSYLNQSRILVHYHHNPLVTPPAAFPQDPAMKRAAVWRAFPAPYGPLGILLDALPTFITGGNVLASLILLKLIFSGMALTCAAIVRSILRRIRPRYALLGMLLVAWNPLILIETSANGHNDIAMMLFVLAALLAVVVERPVLGVGLLALSVLVKYVSILLLPLLFVYAVWHQPTARRRLTYTLQASLFTIAVIAAVYAPFWHGPGTFHNLTLQMNRYSGSFASLLLDLFPHGITAGVAGLIGWAIFVALYNYALWLASGNREELLRGCFLAMLGFAAFALTNVQVWYLEWAVLIAAALPLAAEYVSAGLLAYGVSLTGASWTYVAFWLRADRHPSNAALVDGVSYLITFAPAIAAFVMLWKPIREKKEEPPAR